MAERSACGVAITTASISPASTAARKSVAVRAPTGSANAAARSVERSTARTVGWPSLAIAAARFWPMSPHPTIANRMLLVQAQASLFRQHPAQREYVFVRHRLGMSMQLLPAVPDGTDELTGDVLALAECQIRDEPGCFLGAGRVF